MATTATVTATFSYMLSAKTQFTFQPPPFYLPMPFISDQVHLFINGTTATLTGAGSYQPAPLVGQDFVNGSPGSAGYTAFTTVDVPSLLTAVGAAAGMYASIAGPVTFSVTATSYTRNATDPFTAQPIPITWSTPGLGAYLVTAQEDWTLQSSWASDSTYPPDIRTVTTITATGVLSSGPTATVAYPIRYPPLATFAPASYPLLASVGPPSGLTSVGGFSPVAITPPLTLTGTLTGTALTSPFLLTLMDTNTASEVWTFPTGQEGLMRYGVTPLVLTVPVSFSTQPPGAITATVDGTRARFI